MEERELLAHTMSVLRTLNIRYFVTGSVASGLWGEPRLTNDIDVVAQRLCRTPIDYVYIANGRGS